MNPRRPWRYRPATNRNRRAIEDPAGRSATQHRCRATLPYHAVRAGCNPLVMAARSFPRQPLPGAYRCLSGPRLPARSPPDELRAARATGAGKPALAALPTILSRAVARRSASVNWRLASSHLHHTGGELDGVARSPPSAGNTLIRAVRWRTLRQYPMCPPRQACYIAPIEQVDGSRPTMPGVASRIPQLQYVALGAATGGSDQPAPQR